MGQFNSKPDDTSVPARGGGKVARKTVGQGPKRLRGRDEECPPSPKKVCLEKKIGSAETGPASTLEKSIHLIARRCFKGYGGVSPEDEDVQAVQSGILSADQLHESAYGHSIAAGFADALAETLAEIAQRQETMQARIFCVQDTCCQGCVINVDMKVNGDKSVAYWWSIEQADDPDTVYSFTPQTHALSDQASSVTAGLADALECIRREEPYSMPLWYTVRAGGFFFSGSSLNSQIEEVKFVDGTPQEDDVRKLEALWSLRNAEILLTDGYDSSCWTAYEAAVRRFCEIVGLQVFVKDSVTNEESLEESLEEECLEDYFARHLDIPDIPGNQEMREQLQGFIAHLRDQGLFSAKVFEHLTQADLNADTKFMSLTLLLKARLRSLLATRNRYVRVHI